MTLIEKIKEDLAKGGIENAQSVQVKFNDGTSFVLHSDNDERLQAEVGNGEGVEVKAVSSAKAGGHEQR